MTSSPSTRFSSLLSHLPLVLVLLCVGVTFSGVNAGPVHCPLYTTEYGLSTDGEALWVQGYNVSEKLALIEALNNTVAAQVDVIADLTATVQQLNTTVAEQDDDIAELTATVQQLNTTVNNHTAEIADLKSTIQQLNNTVEDQEDDIIDLKATVQQLNTTVESQEVEIDELRSLIQQLNVTLTNALATTKINVSMCLVGLEADRTYAATNTTFPNDASNVGMQLPAGNYIGSDNDPFTLATWFKVTDWNNGDNYMMLYALSHTRSSTPGDFYLTIQKSNTAFWIGFNGKTQFELPATINTGEWHHIVMVYGGGDPNTGNSYTFYHNNVAKQTTTQQGTSGSTNTDNWLGSWKLSGSVLNRFFGYMTHSNVYDIALTPTEVNCLYQQTPFA